MKDLPKKCHFIGIGGIGMSGLARILLSHSVEVSGSDLHANRVTEGLKSKGAIIYQGHSEKNVQSGTTIIYSSDIKENNPEYQAARSLNLPLWHRSDLLQRMMMQRKSLAVAGTHGKTTTTSLLTCVLLKAEMDPSYIVGGIVSELQSNANYGAGEYLVAEADESDGTFLKYSPFGAIVTNIDNDHMNHYETDEKLDKAFHQFLSQISSERHLFWCGEDLRLKKFASSGISYGFDENSLLRAKNFKQDNWSICFDVHFEEHCYQQVKIPLTGRHNALNALAVFGLAMQLGISEKVIRQAFLEFKGVGRRCERKGESNGVLFLDDYAHHPTELRTTLHAIRKAIGKRRLIAAFQPHRYSRMQHCMGQFDAVFDQVDQLIITEIYSSGESPIPGVSHELLLAEIEQKGKKGMHIPRKELATVLSRTTLPGDVVVSLGAGDITKLAEEVMKLN